MQYDTCTVVPIFIFSNYHNDILFTTVNVLKLLIVVSF